MQQINNNSSNHGAVHRRDEKMLLQDLYRVNEEGATRVLALGQQEHNRPAQVEDRQHKIDYGRDYGVAAEVHEQQALDRLEAKDLSNHLRPVVEEAAVVVVLTKIDLDLVECMMQDDLVVLVQQVVAGAVQTSRL